MRAVIAGSGSARSRAVEAVVDEPAHGRDVALDDGRERRRRRIGADHDRLRGGGDPDQHQQHAEDDDQQDATTRPGVGTEHARSLGSRARGSYRTFVGAVRHRSGAQGTVSVPPCLSSPNGAASAPT